MAEGSSEFALPAPGDLLAGKYRIERLIGQGGMGAVFAAHHEILFQRVAIKLLLAQYARDSGAVARFLNEARAMARIQDEHVARVMDVGTLENGTAFMVLEYLEGVDLAKVIESRGALPLSETIDYAAQALEALGEAHRLGIVHRDMKPSNLFLTRRPNGAPCVKLLDFGISKGASPLAAHNSGITSTGTIMGSPAYMSPEQLKSSKSVDARTDIWSIGVVMYELLTGKSPFDGETLGQVLAAIVEAEVPALNRRDVPASFEAVLLRCMARKPEQRFASAAELAEALRPFASPMALASIQRLCETHPAPAAIQAAASGLARTHALSPAPAEQPQPAQTGASWAPSTESEVSTRPTGSPARVLVAVSVGAVLVLGGAAFLVFGRHGPQPPPASATSGGTSSAPAIAAPLAAEPVPPPASALAATPAPSASADSPTATPIVASAAPTSVEPTHPRGGRGGSSRFPPSPSSSPSHSPLADHPPAPPTPAATSTYDPSHDSRK